MRRKGWYLVGYDIAHPKRLVKIYRMLRKEGLATQKSLFFVKGTEPQLNDLLDRMARIMAPREDDLRAYPIVHPRDVWTNGPNPLADFPILHFGMEEKQTKGKPVKKKQGSRWKQLVGVWKSEWKNNKGGT